MPTLAEVRLWGRRIGAVSLGEGPGGGDTVAAFEYDPAFARSGIEVAPLMMPLAPKVYTFPALPRAAFHGLPGLLADSLPDRFGNALIDAWLAGQGRTPDSFNAVERLCYVGTRGMGALEFHPVIGTRSQRSSPLDVAALVTLASEVLAQRAHHATLDDILRVGTSAGGARAKAIIAWNPATNEVRSGQVTAPPGFGYWLLKFDGVLGNRDKERDDPQGYGALEYTYWQMAVAAGIEMTDCALLAEGPRRHFMTRRFDRLKDGGKLHAQSLGAMGHFDFNQAGGCSYEQAFAVMRRLGLRLDAIEEQYRRMVFNIVARNQDDHVKNIAFLMNREGEWRLAPAYDLTYNHNPQGAWTSSHQMSVNGKRDGFTVADLKAAAATAGLMRGRAESIIAEVTEVVAKFPAMAQANDVAPTLARHVQSNLRVALPKR